MAAKGTSAAVYSVLLPFPPNPAAIRGHYHSQQGYSKGMHELSSSIPVDLASRRGLTLTSFVLVTRYLSCTACPKRVAPEETQPILGADLTHKGATEITGWICVRWKSLWLTHSPSLSHLISSNREETDFEMQGFFTLPSTICYPMKKKKKHAST